MSSLGLDVKKLVDAIQNSLPSGKDRFALHEPEFFGKEWDYVKECLDTGWVSSVGKYVDRFEQMLSDYTGVNYAVAVVNGTAALHICLKLAGVERDDEVLIPALTFVATANALSYCGAIPHFVDSEERTLGLDPFKLRGYLEEICVVREDGCYNQITGRRIKAVVPMHTFGHPVDLDPLVVLCKEYNIELIEDAAESLGSFYKGKHTGHRGKLSALSFNGNKIITTGGGGAILTNDKNLAQQAKHITTTAKVPHKWEFVHDQIGYNFRLPNINAALGCAQLEQLPTFLKNKRKLAEKYNENLKDIEGVRFFTESSFAESNYWLNALLLDQPSERYKILEETNKRGVMTRPAWNLLSALPMYTDCPKMSIATAKNLQERLINIPSNAFLGGHYE